MSLTPAPALTPPPARTPRRVAMALVRLARPHQWVKNALLLVPVITAHRIGDAASLAAEGRAIVAMCLASSAVYVINDRLDVGVDRNHPRKRLRPVAAGEVDIGWTLPYAAVLIAAAMLVAWPLPAAFGASLALYLAGALAYSLRFKRVRGLDVVMLAGLHVLRVVQGAAAIAVPLSPWLLGFAACLFLSLSLVKRYVELDGAAREGRAVGPARGYRIDDRRGIAAAGAVFGAMAVLVLARFPASGEAFTYYREPRLLLLLAPLVGAWLVRAWLVATRGRMHDDPILFALRDAPSYAVIVAMLAVTQLAL